MAAEGREFKGVIFFGLMLTEKGPRVLEYNARFGDPEAQVVLPRMKNDIVEVFEACIDGTLDKMELEFEDNAAVCVVLASGGYPVAYEKGHVIHGLEQFENREGCFVFHAGTKRTEAGIVTNGGRVLGVTATGADLKTARANAYEAVKLVNFEKAYCRLQIAAVPFYIQKKSPAVREIRKQRIRPRAVGRAKDSSVQRRLFVSWYMVIRVVEQGQWNRENARVQAAVTQVQPCPASSSFNAGRLSGSDRIPCPR